MSDANIFFPKDNKYLRLYTHKMDLLEYVNAILIVLVILLLYMIVTKNAIKKSISNAAYDSHGLVIIPPSHDFRATDDQLSALNVDKLGSAGFGEVQYDTESYMQDQLGRENFRRSWTENHNVRLPGRQQPPKPKSVAEEKKSFVYEFINYDGEEVELNKNVKYIVMEQSPGNRVWNFLSVKLASGNGLIHIYQNGTKLHHQYMDSKEISSLKEWLLNNDIINPKNYNTNMRVELELLKSQS
jgi:hypothetical protein